MKIISQEKAQESIMSAVNTLADLVKPTYGPAENKVIIGKNVMTATGMVATASALDDGVQIAKDLTLEDEAENYVLELIREVAVKTNERVGDGTTSSLIMLQAIMQEAQKSGLTSNQIVSELRKGLSEVVKQLKEKSRAISTKKELEEVALVSFNNQEIAKLLAKLVYQIGENGIIDVQASQGASIESEIVAGFKIESGYVSPYMATEADKCVLENAVVLVTDKSFNNNTEIVPVMEKVLADGKSTFVVFCKDFTGEALTTAILNKLKGGFKLLAVKTMEQDLKDIALLTGANHVLLEGKIESTDFGFAKRIVSNADTTKIVGGKGNKDLIAQTVEELKKDPENNARVANLTGSVAIIRVGAKTESEAKALQFKIEDASNAVKVAFKGGVVPGAGQTLASLKTSCALLNAALKYPQKQLMENVLELEVDESIVDPTEVLIAGVECAVSIACLLITSKSIIYDVRPKLNDRP